MFKKLHSSNLINIFETENICLKEEIQLELNTPLEPYNLFQPLTFSEIISYPNKPPEYNFDKTYDNYQIDDNLDIQYRLQDGDLLDLDDYDKLNNSISDTKFDFGSDVDVSIDLGNEKNLDHSHGESIYDSDADEEKDIFLHTKVNEITNLLFDPYPNKENNPLLTIQENFNNIQNIVEENKKQNANQLQSTKTETKKIQKQIIKPTQKQQIIVQTPLEYIASLENTFLQKFPEYSYNLNVLHQYAEANKIKVDLLIEQVDELEASIHKISQGDDSQISFCIDYDRNFLYVTSRNSPEIRKFCLNKKVLLESFIAKLKDSSIFCMDALDGLLVCGCSDGYIFLFHHSKKGILEKVDKVKTERGIPIISIKFIQQTIKDNLIEIVVSDIRGELFIVNFKKQIFSKVERYFIIDPFSDRPYNPEFKLEDMKAKLTEERQLELCQHDYHPMEPIYVLEIINQKLNNEYNQYLGEKEYPVMLIGISFDQILFYQLKPKLNLIQSFPKPHYIKSKSISDLAVGVGTLPYIKKGESSIKENEKALLFVTNWENFIYIYKPVISSSSCKEIQLCAHYIHSSNIIRIGFLRNNYIYVFDSNFILSIIDTRNFQEGDVNTDPQKEKDVQIKGNLAINEIDLSKHNYGFYTQNFFEQEESKKIYRCCISKYTKKGQNGSIEEGISFMGKNKISKFYLTNFDNLINSIVDNKCFEFIYNFYLRMFKNENHISELLVSSETKKDDLSIITYKKSQESFTTFTLHHLNKIAKLNYNQTINNNNDPSLDPYYQMRLFIQFFNIGGFMKRLFMDSLIEIKNISLLNLFIECLEIFIYGKDEITINSLNKEIVFDIIDYHIKKNNRIDLSRLLMFVNKNLLTTKEIQAKIEDEELLHPVIFLNTDISPNLREPNFFHPIKYMFSLFNSKQNNEKYIEFIINKKDDSYNEEIITSRQSYGHRLLWYCNYCFEAKTYPRNKFIKYNYFEKIVYQIYLLLLTEKVSKKFLEFDSFSYYSVIEKLYMHWRLKPVIDYEKKLDSTEEQYITSLGLLVPLNEIKPIKILSAHIQMCLSMKNNFYILYDLFTFCYKYFQEYKEKARELDNNILIEAIAYLFSFKKQKLQQPKELDPFNYHAYMSEFIDEECEKIDQMALFFFRLITNITENEKKRVIDLALENDNVQFQLNFYQDKLDATKMFEIRKQLYENDTNENNDNRIGALFLWFKKTFSILSKQYLRESRLLKQLKSVFLDNLNYLYSINVSGVMEILGKFFLFQMEDVIKALDNNIPLQFELLKYILQIDESEEEKNLSQTIPRIPVLKELSEYSKDAVYFQFIKLSAEFGEIDNLDKIVKERPSIWNLKLDNIFKKSNAFVCAISVTNLQSRFFEPIDIVNKALEEIYAEIVNNLKSSNYKERKHLFLMDKFNFFISLGNNFYFEGINEWKPFIKSPDDLRLKFEIFKNEHFYNKLEFKFELININHLVSKYISGVLAKIGSRMGVLNLLQLRETKNCNLKFKDLRKPIVDELYVYQRSTIYFKKTLTNFKTDTVVSAEQLANKISKGKQFKIGFKHKDVECPVCNIDLSIALQNNDSKFNNLIVFQCGHVYHLNCAAIENNEYVCYICSSKENHEPISSLNIQKIDKNKIEIKEEEENDEEKREKYLKQAKNKIEKLKQIRKKTNQTYEFFNKLKKKEEPCFKQI